MQRVHEALKFTIVEFALALTLFREELGPQVLLLFFVLFFFKFFHVVLDERIDTLTQHHGDPNQAPVPKFTHIRLISLTAILLCTNGISVSIFSQMLVDKGVSVLLLFLFEYSLLALEVTRIAYKYTLLFLSRGLAVLGPDGTYQPWQEKQLFALYGQLFVNVIKLAVYVVYFCLIASFFGMPLVMLRDVIRAFSDAKREITNLLAVRRLKQQMNKVFVPPTAEDLQKYDPLCSICHDDITDAPESLAASVLFPCSHMFHRECILHWFHQQQRCPMCSTNIDELVERAEKQKRDKERADATVAYHTAHPHGSEEAAAATTVQPGSATVEGGAAPESASGAATAADSTVEDTTAAAAPEAELAPSAIAPAVATATMVTTPPPPPPASAAAGVGPGAVGSPALSRVGTRIPNAATTLAGTQVAVGSAAALSRRTALGSGEVSTVSDMFGGPPAPAPAATATSGGTTLGGTTSGAVAVGSRDSISQVSPTAPQAEKTVDLIAKLKQEMRLKYQSRLHQEKESPVTGAVASSVGAGVLGRAALESEAETTKESRRLAASGEGVAGALNAPLSTPALVAASPALSAPSAPRESPVLPTPYAAPLPASVPSASSSASAPGATVTTATTAADVLIPPSPYLTTDAISACLSGAAAASSSNEYTSPYLSSRLPFYGVSASPMRTPTLHSLGAMSGLASSTPDQRKALLEAQVRELESRINTLKSARKSQQSTPAVTPLMAAISGRALFASMQSPSPLVKHEPIFEAINRPSNTSVHTASVRSTAVVPNGKETMSPMLQMQDQLNKSIDSILSADLSEEQKRAIRAKQQALLLQHKQLEIEIEQLRLAQLVNEQPSGGKDKNEQDKVDAPVSDSDEQEDSKSAMDSNSNDGNASDTSGLDESGRRAQLPPSPPSAVTSANTTANSSPNVLFPYPETPKFRIPPVDPSAQEDSPEK